MATKEFIVVFIRDGEKFLRVLDETEAPIPNPEAWAAAVEERDIGFLVARIGSTAVGSLMIRWAGANPREKLFYDVVTSSFPDDWRPSPAIYALKVVEEHWGKRISHDLMQGAEDAIYRRPGLANRAVLSVREDNDVARNLYDSRGFRILNKDGQEVFTNTVPSPQEDGSFTDLTVSSVFMAKELE
jgi:ribosomal protein S18 acetylase RimI-like enzyme